MSRSGWMLAIALITLVWADPFVLGGAFGESIPSVEGTAPFVSAAAALIKAKNPGLNNTSVRLLLRNNAMDLGDSGWDMLYG